VFGRSRSSAAEAPATTPTTALTEKQGGKGRPTPRRREAEQRNRRPVVGSTRLSPNATKEERKAARAARRKALSAERMKAREAMLTGDEAHMPIQHRGPAKRFARDYVDSRWNLGELLLPLALVVVVLGMVPQLQVVSLLFVPALYLFAIAVIVNGVFMARRINRMAVERFGESARGVGRYGAFRSAQVRRFRTPRPMVKRGQPPA
jgi:flagellar biosynthesis protein FliQ